MAVYAIVLMNYVDLKDRELYEDYVDKADPIIYSFGGRYLAQTDEIYCFAGELVPDRAGIIKFPNMKAFNDCFGSEEYQRISGVRMNISHTRVLVVEGNKLIFPTLDP